MEAPVVHVRSDFWLNIPRLMIPIRNIKIENNRQLQIHKNTRYLNIRMCHLFRITGSAVMHLQVH